MKCPLPGMGTDNFGGFCIEIDQVEFGHICRKRTWLYIVGLNINELVNVPFPGRKPSRVISSAIGKPTLKRAAKKFRNYTPLPLAKELIRLCSLIAPTGYDKLPGI
jgi:hypothetical protein